MSEHTLYTRRLRNTGLALLMAMSWADHAVSAQAVPDPNAFLGRWQALYVTKAGQLQSEDLFDFEFARGDSGLVFKDRGRFPMVGPPSAVTFSAAGKVHTEWKQIMPFTLSLDGRVIEEGRVLEATVRGLGFLGRGVLTLRLTRSAPEARAYFAPRATAAGVRVRRYDYRLPEAIPGSWPVATPEAAGIDRTSLERLVRGILDERDGVGDRHTDAVLVLRHGKLVLEEYFWGARRELAHPIASITKSVGSMLAGIAIDSGRFGLDDLVIDHFPEYRDRLWQRSRSPIRVRDLLSMTAGVEWTDHSAADQYTQRFLAAEDQLGFVMDLPAREAPGARYNYNNGLPSLLGPLITRRVGEPVETFADRVLFEPLGIRNYAWATLRDGTPLLAGGLRMPPRDMAKLGQLVLSEGVWKGRRLISRDWITVSTTRQTRADDYPYGFYWHLSDPSRPWHGNPPSYLGPIDRYRAIMGVGQGGQAIVVLPEVDVVIVIASSNWLPGMVDAFPTRLINGDLVGGFGSRKSGIGNRE